MADTRKEKSNVVSLEMARYRLRGFTGLCAMMKDVQKARKDDEAGVTGGWNCENKPAHIGPYMRRRKREKIVDRHAKGYRGPFFSPTA